MSEHRKPPRRREARADFEVFRGALTTWESLFRSAAEFATALGRDRVISISHSEDANEGVVTVWFWNDYEE